jgi:hypothetical protein
LVNISRGSEKGAKNSLLGLQKSFLKRSRANEPMMPYLSLRLFFNVNTHPYFVPNLSIKSWQGPEMSFEYVR